MNPDTDTRPAGGTPLNPKTPRSQAPLVQPTPGPSTHAVRLFWPTAIVLLVLVGSVVMVLTPWKATRPTSDLDVAGTPPQVQHDSGIARLVREREQELDAQHDSGIARLLREREQEPRSAP